MTMVGFALCRSCGHRVQVAPGFCTTCGTTFDAATLGRQVVREGAGVGPAPRYTLRLKLEVKEPVSC